MPATDLFPLDPDYTVPVGTDGGVLRQRAASGRVFQRQLRPPQRQFELGFARRSTDEVEQIRDWYDRFQQRYFVFNHKTWLNNAGTYLARKFPVTFAAEPQYELLSNDAWNVQVSFLEAVGEALQSADYPDPTAGHASFKKEEDHPDAIALAGAWTTGADGSASAGVLKTNPNVNTTDAFQWIYAGYGFALWSIKNSNLGIYEVLLDETSLGNVDLYNATKLSAARVFSKFDVPLGIHRVKIRATDTKNPSSSAKTIIADALEVLP